MGTNFYWDPPDTVPDDMDPKYHIGKRSAAGMYCYDCSLTMCAAGESQVHHGGPRGIRFMTDAYKEWEKEAWYEKCPKCGAEREEESLKESATGVELGFAEAKVERPTGLKSCCSFSYCQDPEEVKKRCLEAGDDIALFDEYGSSLTGTEFLAMLEAQCPIKFTASIGQWFS